MKMLVISLPDLYEAGRFREEGLRLGHCVDIVPFDRLSFVIRPRRRTVLVDGRDLFRSYDTIYLRHFYPYVSEALHLAEWARRRGLRVIDRRLAEQNFVQSKMYNYWKLAEAGLPVPAGFQVMNLKAARRLLGAGRWPVVAKGVHGSRGRYVFRIGSPNQAKRELTEDLVGFFTFQDFLKIDAEYRVMTVGFKALGAMQKLPPAGDFRHNLAVGATGVAADLPPRFMRLCEKAARVLGQEMCGIDLAVSRGRPCILEANRTPGFEGFEPATGVNVAAAFLSYAAKK
jgi:RimK family alpha-L-glutamate ligase